MNKILEVLQEVIDEAPDVKVSHAGNLYGMDSEDCPLRPLASHVRARMKAVLPPTKTKEPAG